MPSAATAEGRGWTKHYDTIRRLDGRRLQIATDDIPKGRTGIRKGAKIMAIW